MPDQSDIDSISGGTFPTNESAVVGSESSQGSLRLLQSIFNEITGKSATITKSYNDSFKFTKEDFVQLNHRIMQSYEQYNIATSNCSIVVYYSDSHKDTWPNFDDFIYHIAASNTSVESIFFEYNFMIVSPEKRKLQSYAMRIMLNSRISIEKKLKKQFGEASPKVLRIISDKIGNVEIRYDSYVVARSMQSVIDEWFNGVQRYGKNNFIGFSQSKSYLIPGVFRFVTVLFALFTIARFLPNFVEDSSLISLGRFMLGTFGCVFTVYLLSSGFGRIVEDAIDNLSELSYINVNNGDQIEIDAGINNNKSHLSKAILGFFGGFLTSVAVEVIAISLVDYMRK